MLSLEEISDRFEIQQLLIDYSTAIDRQQFDDLDRVFTPDAYIDYRVTGGIDGRFPEVKAWLARRCCRRSSPPLPHAGQLRCAHQRRHRVVADHLLQPDGVRRGRSQILLRRACWYVDEFIRTAEGWRMSKRVEEKCFDKLLVKRRRCSRHQRRASFAAARCRAGPKCARRRAD